MTVVVTLLAVVVALLVVLVAGLLRSHALILSKLEELGAGIGDPSGADAPDVRAAPGRPCPDCRRWRRACSAISATTWCARWSGWRSPSPTRSARRTRFWCAPP